MHISIIWIVLSAIASIIVGYLWGVTWGCLIVIISFFAYSLWNVSLLWRAYTAIKNANNSEDRASSLNESKLAQLWEAYQATINVTDGELRKSNIPSVEFFSLHRIARCWDLNLRIVDASAGTLVGLGLLGTFLGLTLGINNFDTSNANNIQSSIHNLLDGMGTAFATSLVGMGLSIIYTITEKRLRNLLMNSLMDFTEALDQQYYIDDQRLLLLSLEPKLTYTNEMGERIPISLAIRDMLNENAQQSKALKAFSTDLADRLNEGFDEILSRQMQARIIPLMENVDQTTKTIIEHIDHTAEIMSAPATDLIKSVIDELKKSMESLINEFRTNISNSASNELQHLVASLGEATTSMSLFPKNLEDVITALQLTMDEVKSSITEISSSSANATSSAMKHMQEQVTFATTSLSNVMLEVKEIISSLTQTSEQTSQKMMNKMTAASEQIGTILNGMMNDISTSVKSSMQSITDDISDKQTGLMALQKSTISETEKLLERFNVGLERLEKMNEHITGTMNAFQLAQGQINGSTTQLQSISSKMKLASEEFQETQIEYATKMNDLQERTLQAISSIANVLQESGSLSKEYVEKFDIIRNGIGGIFAQIQKGMTEYSQYVQSSTQRYLEDYSRELTKATNALSGAIQQQNEVTEVIAEELGKFRKR